MLNRPPGLWSQMWREILFPYLRLEPWRADPKEGLFLRTVIPGSEATTPILSGC
jgi:hypothetical protein